MKTLLSAALGGAVAGLLVHLLLRRRSGDDDWHETMEMIADTNLVHGGDAAREQRGPQPWDWRGAQNVQDC